MTIPALAFALVFAALTAAAFATDRLVRLLEAVSL